MIIDTMLVTLTSAIFLALFSFFNLFGIRQGLVNNQISFLIVSLFVFFIVKRLGWRFFKNNAGLFYWIFVGLLILTYIIGFEARGSKRWIDLYFFNFQTSEFLKVFFIVYLAHSFSVMNKYIDSFSSFLKNFFLAFIPIIVIFLQPDLGNAAVYVFIYVSMLLFSLIPKRYFLYLMVAGILVLPTGFFFLKDYQKTRLTSFLSGSEDQRGASYNMIQAVITTGSGQFAGRGLGYGTQSKLLYLPENHTDFAYSSLVEQFGFIGGVIVLVLYLLIITSLLKKCVKYASGTDQERNYLFLFLIGFLAYFTFQTFINIGMNMGLVPIVGIALPFISYGGSAMVTLAIGLALIP